MLITVCGFFDGAVCKPFLDPPDNTNRFPMILSNAPSGASIKSFAHYGQLVDQPKETFRRFDYGKS